MNQIREASLSLLSAIAFDSNALREALRLVDPDWLPDSLHRRALRIAQELVSDPGSTLDPHQWSIALARARGVDSEAIRELFLTLSGHPANPEAFPSLAKILREDWERRMVRQVSLEVASELEDPLATVDAAVAKLRAAERFMLGRAVDSVSGTDALLQSDAEISAGRIVASGFPNLDTLLDGGGFRPGELCVVGGRPSMGKTAFAITVARNAALAGHAVGFVTLEMTPPALARRFAAYRPEAIRLLNFAMPRERTVRSIERIASRWKSDGLLDFLVVDYLGLLYPEGRRHSRYEDVSDLSQDMKRLASTLGVPTMLLAQLNRGLAGRPDKRPQLADFRDSGSIEQDADQAILLHRPGYYEGNRNDPESYADLAKQRNGQTGNIRLHWIPSQMRFDNYSSFPG